MNEEIFDSALIVIRKFIEKDDLDSAIKEVGREFYCVKNLNGTSFDNGHAEEQQLKLSSLLQVLSDANKTKQDRLDYIRNMIF